MAQSRVVNLKSRPGKGQSPTLDNFELLTVDLPDLNDGQCLLKNLYMTIDPASRPMMEEREGSYVQSFELGKPLFGLCIGQVVESKLEGTEQGDVIVHYDGWKEHSVLDGSGMFLKVDPTQGPLPAFLNVMGIIGFTANVAVNEIARIGPDDVVFVSAAAGGVGTIACQLAKIAGARVIGSVGSDEKIDYLVDELGIDAAINFRKLDGAAGIEAAVREHFPEGIDVYLELVGAEHADAALELLKEFGRFTVVGQLAAYDDEKSFRGPKHFTLVNTQSLTIQGFIAFNHMDKYGEFQQRMGSWIKSGQIKYQETIREGLDSAPQALLDMFDGKNVGKMMVKLGELI